MVAGCVVYVHLHGRGNISVALRARGTYTSLYVVTVTEGHLHSVNPLQPILNSTRIPMLIYIGL